MEKMFNIQKIFDERKYFALNHLLHGIVASKFQVLVYYIAGVGISRDSPGQS